MNFRHHFLLPGMFILGMSGQANAQTENVDLACEKLSSYYCNLDLSSPIPGIKLDSLTGAKGIIYGSSGKKITDFKDVLYAQDPNRECDMYNKKNNYCLSTPYELRYYVYYPSAVSGAKINCPLPFIIMFHGGSFYECSSIDNDNISTMCREMAKRGFVVFSVEYRRGSIPDPRLSPNGYYYMSAQQILATYRACQDARGAIRSILQRQLQNDNGGKFQLDTSKMFLGGLSAGSIIALNAAYYERQGQIDSTYSFAGKVLGDIDAPFYTADPDINFFPHIKGVLNLWGILGISKNYWDNPVDFLGGNSNYPALISFQGAKDQLFYPGKQYLYFSANGIGKDVKFDFSRETRCLVKGNDFQLDNDSESPDAISLGADGLYYLLHNKGVPTEEYIDLQMEHGLDACDTCTNNNFFQSDFGTGLKEENAVYSYIAGRAATFFTTVLSGKASKLGKTRFIECENKRTGCNTADNACDSDEANCIESVQ